ncbi:Basic-leucine zipper (bZIP) transcription factor family protein [Actinidia rufa]|uniref:Basic-leucine zipper (BZIP) transcription factor family protein n=1 Tax=Actinidia rufa TaxID=165716 RepID=A0A7J0F0I9_9ERIC|nr:Basic-leucine zipper (bZIP) transcription factor family protein [Actinidia rufa]
MDDGEVEISDHGLLPNPYSSSNIQTSASIDSFLDEFMKSTTRTCTHSHTCNPPGPNSTHTHTCYHTHTQIIPSEEDEGEESRVVKSRRPLGNREAVRKYREKKKAHTAYLEEEVKKLRLLNRQLVRKLQGQAILEAEILRLRGLLMDIRGKIDSELGVFPFQNKCNSSTSFKDGDCGVESNGSGMGLQCENDLPCFHPHPGAASNVDGSGKMFVSWEKHCQPPVIDCRANIIDAAEPLMSSTSQAE